MDEREDRIRERAYRLWEADGCPFDRTEHYWFEAEKLIAAEDAANAAAASPRPEVDPNVAMESQEHEPVSEIGTIRRALEVPPKRRGKRSPAADRKGAMSGLDGARLED
ncbi:DUF2934 domain-containing protein [Ancylobacter defluvii]|uniref:DUF2934 domain-containing protein n=1 Tax=Ancylobacter defluvii TaxID=1282440 RepID=A0A9W6JXR4_9HYPH|nr:DUF2934 domain-containing protein [Ancylobacter defluvii]MBS7586528.1 DUF2934 domain-containing protein [Ancylobacter defluvii]GLK85815.1 hypothetical protein GCM10017653_38850 [Ancylobacter defluvii]